MNEETHPGSFKADDDPSSKNSSMMMCACGLAIESALGKIISKCSACIERLTETRECRPVGWKVLNKARAAKRMILHYFESGFDSRMRITLNIFLDLGFELEDLPLLEQFHGDKTHEDARQKILVAARKYHNKNDTSDPSVLRETTIDVMSANVVNETVGGMGPRNFEAAIYVNVLLMTGKIPPTAHDLVLDLLMTGHFALLLEEANIEALDPPPIKNKPTTTNDDEGPVNHDDEGPVNHDDVECDRFPFRIQKASLFSDVFRTPYVWCDRQNHFSHICCDCGTSSCTTWFVSPEGPDDDDILRVALCFDCVAMRISRSMSPRDRLSNDDDDDGDADNEEESISTRYDRLVRRYDRLARRRKRVSDEETTGERTDDDDDNDDEKGKEPVEIDIDYDDRLARRYDRLARRYDRLARRRKRVSDEETTDKRTDDDDDNDEKGKEPVEIDIDDDDHAEKGKERSITPTREDHMEKPSQKVIHTSTHHDDMTIEEEEEEEDFGGGGGGGKDDDPINLSATTNAAMPSRHLHHPIVLRHVKRRCDAARTRAMKILQPGEHVYDKKLIDRLNSVSTKAKQIDKKEKLQRVMFLNLPGYRWALEQKMELVLNCIKEKAIENNLTLPLDIDDDETPSMRDGDGDDDGDGDGNDDSTPPEESGEDKSIIHTSPPRWLEEAMEGGIDTVDDILLRADVADSTCPPRIQEQVREDWQCVTNTFISMIEPTKDISFTWNDSWSIIYQRIAQIKRITRGYEKYREWILACYCNSLRGLLETSRRECIHECTTQVELVRYYLSYWASYVVATKNVADIMIMHTFSLPTSKDLVVPDTYAASMHIWRVCMYEPLKDRLFAAVIELLNELRRKQNHVRPSCVIDVGARVVEYDEDSLLESEESILLSSTSQEALRLTSALMKNLITLAPLHQPLEHCDEFIRGYVEDVEQYIKQDSAQTLSGWGAFYHVHRIHHQIEVEKKILDRLQYQIGEARADDARTTSQQQVYCNVYEALLHACWSCCPAITSLHEVYGDASTKLRKLAMETITREGLSSHLRVILHSSREFATQGCWKTLSKMYHLIRMIGQDKAMERSLERHLNKLVLDKISSIKEEKIARKGKREIAEQLILSLIKCKQYYTNVFEKAFPGNKMYSSSIVEKALKSAMGKNNTIAYELALFMDGLLSNTRQSRMDVLDDFHIDEHTLVEQAADILHHIVDKDIFQTYYTHFLGLRLIHKRSPGFDMENIALSHLKTICGISFTSLAEKMLKDVDQSDHYTDHFKTWKYSMVNFDDDGDAPVSIEIIPTIVSVGCWPSTVLARERAKTCTLPHEVESAWKMFCIYYESQPGMSGRKLTLLPHLGMVEMNFWHSGRKYRLSASTSIMIVLQLFNHRSRTATYSYEEIYAHTGLDDGILSHTLRCLVYKRPGGRGSRALLKRIKRDDDDDGDGKRSDAKQRVICRTDSYCISDRFRSSKLNLKITIGEGKSIAPQRQQNPIAQEIKKNRDGILEACIVRLMKDRKTMSYNALVSEVTLQLSSRFQPKMVDIKQRLQRLIDLEYIARSPDDMNTFVYLA